jgi:hypothetical protein
LQDRAVLLRQGGQLVAQPQADAVALQPPMFLGISLGSS